MCFALNSNVPDEGKDEKNIRHLRLGHEEEDSVVKVMNRNNFMGIAYLKSEQIKFYPYARGKEMHNP